MAPVEQLICIVYEEKSSNLFKAKNAPVIHLEENLFLIILSTVDRVEL
jgi:hypothetical protein